MNTKMPTLLPFIILMAGGALTALCDPQSCKIGCCNSFDQCATSPNQCEIVERQCTPETCLYGCCQGSECGKIEHCFEYTTLKTVLMVLGAVFYTLLTCVVSLKDCHER